MYDEFEIDNVGPSLHLDSEWSSSDVDIDITSQTLTVSTSLKEDVFYITEVYEYSIKQSDSSGIILEQKLREKVTRPPEEYLVKGGETLESDTLLGTTKADLSKSLLWHPVPEGAVKFFTLWADGNNLTDSQYKLHLSNLKERIDEYLIKAKIAIRDSAQAKNLTLKETEKGYSIFPIDKDSEELWKECERIEKEVFLQEKNANWSEKYLLGNAKSLKRDVQFFLEKDRADHSETNVSLSQEETSSLQQAANKQQRSVWLILALQALGAGTIASLILDVDLFSGILIGVVISIAFALVQWVAVTINFYVLGGYNDQADIFFEMMKVSKIPEPPDLDASMAENYYTELIEDTTIRRRALVTLVSFITGLAIARSQGAFSRVNKLQKAHERALKKYKDHLVIHKGKI